MGPVRDDEHHSERSLNGTPTISAAKLFSKLVENINTNSSGSGGSSTQTRDKSKSPPLTNDKYSLPSHRTPSPPMETPDFNTSNTKHTSSNLSQRILEGFQSHHHHQVHEPSPTDSHPRSRPRPNSRSRHRIPRSSETIFAMLLIAAERLSQETARANEAERQASEILAHFKITHQTKQRLEIDLQRVKDELGLYKTQLDIAQSEIHRAQEIVDKVDRQRADAEDEALRGREKVRKLTEARAIESAMEEGRRLGYEEGMRQGRLNMQARDTTHYHQGSSLHSARDDDDQASYFSYSQEERHSVQSSRPATNRSTSVRRASNARHVAHPIPPASALPVSNDDQVPSSASKNGHNSSRPESIAIQSRPINDSNPTISIHPNPVRNYSPTVSHPPFKLPPDGYIPTVGANAAILLPPPHELSIPVAPTGVPRPFATPVLTATSSNLKQERKKGSASQSSEYADRGSRERTLKCVDGDNASHYTLSRQRRTNTRNNQSTHTRPKSEASGVSTHISESSLLGRRDDVRANKNKEVDYFNEEIRSELRASTQPERMAAKWRCLNPDIRSPSPQSAFLDRHNNLTSRMRVNFTIERPKSTDPNQRPQSRSSRSPREIVLPTSVNPSTVQKPDRSAQETTHQRQNEYDTPMSPGHRDARPQFDRRSGSNITVPGIEIVTPSSHTSTLSGRTVIDPVLLTPESANRPIPLPASSQVQSTVEAPPTPGLGLYLHQSSPASIVQGDEHRITMVLPDNNFPPGFVPLSPIPGMTNLNSYPSGFSLSAPKLQDEHGGRLPANFSYPSSPLVRSGA